MATPFYMFTVPGMGPQSPFFQTAIKKNAIFPAGTRAKRVGNDMVFGATFRELLGDVRDAMNRFIYKLGKELSVPLDASQTEFVKKNVKFNTQKNKHLEWVMPFDSKGIVYTLTHDADNQCLIIGAFSYLHRLDFEMIDEAAYYKQQLIVAFDTEDSDLLAQTKRAIRKANWPSCFDDIVFEEESDEEDVEPEPEEVHVTVPVALVATITTTPAAITFASVLKTKHEVPADNAPISAAPTQALAPTEHKICWVCDKSADMCKC